MRLALAGLLLSTAASASPFTIGAGFGQTQDETNSKQTPNETLTVLGRMGVTQRFSLELDITSVRVSNYSNRTATGLAVFDLGTNPHWVPQLFAGLGVFNSDLGYGSATGHQLEGGVGLEYRATGGLTIGARFHIGDRSTDSTPLIEPLACCTDDWSPATLNDGQYRSLDVYGGIRF